MDVVVYLALGVLTSVFLVALFILVFMCYRRRADAKKLKYNTSPLRFSTLAEVENIENLGQLTPLIGELLDKNVWMYDVSGLLQHSVAVLRLCRTMTDKLSAFPLNQATPQLGEAICMATQRVMPRFDDLLCAVASPSVDIRVLEARATALATVCWALVMPFSIINIKYKEMLTPQLTEMSQHLTSLRMAAELAERTEHSRVDIDWDKMIRGTGNDDDEDENDEEEEGGESEADGDVASDETDLTTLLHTTETTPLVEADAVNEARTDCKPSTSQTSASSPSTPLKRSTPPSPLVKPSLSNGGTPIRTNGALKPNGGTHPVDPTA